MTDKITPALRSKVIQCFELYGSEEKVDKVLHVGLKIIRHILRTYQYSKTVDGRGRPELQPYIVATKKVSESWDNALPSLKAARREYDEGKVELCQGRDGENIILYSIPRRQIINRKKLLGE